MCTSRHNFYTNQPKTKTLQTLFSILFQKLYKTLSDLTTNDGKHTGCTNYTKFYQIVHNFFKSLQNYTTIYKTLPHFTQLYKTRQRSTNLYIIIQTLYKLYKTIHKYTKHYNTLHNFYNTKTTNLYANQTKKAF